MKLFTNLVLVFLFVSLGSCCKRSGYPVPEVSIQYSMDYGGPFVYDIQTSKNDLKDIKDTIQLYGELNSNLTYGDGFKVRLFPDEGGEFSHIIMTADRSRLDTLTKFNVNRDRCEKVEDINYHWNGEYSTLTYREVMK